MWIGIIAALLLIFLLCLAEGRRELKFFKITRYTLRVPAFEKLDGEKKIILLADLHNKSYGEHNSELLDAIQREKPDLILIAGDMLVGKDVASYGEALDFVTRLPEICPVYYGPGNHEQRLKEYPEKYEKSVYRKFKNELSRSGVHYLENQKAEMRLDRLDIRVDGLELPMHTYEKFKKHSVDEADIRRCLGRADQHDGNGAEHRGAGGIREEDARRQQQVFAVGRAASENVRFPRSASRFAGEASY